MVITKHAPWARFWGMAAAVMPAFVLAFGPATLYAQGKSAPKKDGIFITVPNPITSGAVNQIKSKIGEAIKRLGKSRDTFTIVYDFNPKGHASGTSDFGPCHDLAEYITNLGLRQVNTRYPAMTTIAFVHNEVSKHTVLPVLACDYLVMSTEEDRNTRRPKAQIGDVLRNQEVGLSGTKRKAYEDVARKYSKAVVFRMIDKDLVIVKVQTLKGQVYLTQAEYQRKLDDGEKLEKLELPTGLEAGTTMIDAEQARSFGLCKEHYNTPAALANALHLPRSSLSEDWLGDRTKVVWRIELRGALDPGKLESLERRIKSAIGRHANFIILQLESEGGATKDALSTALWLSTLTDENNLPVKTIAYIPRKCALGAATFLALGCNEIVMAKDAFLGDFSYLPDKTPDNLNRKREMLVKLARDQGYPPALFEAMLNPDLVLYRVQSRKEGDYQLVTEAEFEKDKALPAPLWHKVDMIHPGHGQFLKVNARMARDWDVVRYYDVDSPEELYAKYDLEASRVKVARDDWLDKVAEFFREPIVNVILIMLGIIGLILELKMPGVGLPGIISAVCFVLFFWAYSFVGEFTMLAVLLFVLGLILIGIEIFVLPGFGITGISGIVLVVGSLVLVTLERMPETSQDWLNLGATLSTFGFSLVLAIVGAFMLAWYLPHIPYANRLVLVPPTEESAETEASAGDRQARAALLGAIGLAETTLRPAGKARFGDEFLDVIAEGDYINPGSRVQVIEIEGNRIVVKEV